MNNNLIIFILISIFIIIISYTVNNSKINEYFSAQKCNNCIFSNKVINPTNCTTIETSSQALAVIRRECFNDCKSVVNEPSPAEVRQLKKKLSNACKFVIESAKAIKANQRRQAKLANAAKLAKAARLAEQRRIRAAKLANAAKLAKAARLAEQRRIRAAKLANAAKLAKAARLAEQRRIRAAKAEQRRIRAAKLANAAKLAKAARLAEQRRIRAAKLANAAKLAKAARLAEQRRIRAAKLAKAVKAKEKTKFKAGKKKIKKKLSFILVDQLKNVSFSSKKVEEFTDPAIVKTYDAKKKYVLHSVNTGPNWRRHYMKYGNKIIGKKITVGREESTKAPYISFGGERYYYTTPEFDNVIGKYEKSRCRSALDSKGIGLQFASLFCRAWKNDKKRRDTLKYGWYLRSGGSRPKLKMDRYMKIYYNKEEDIYKFVFHRFLETEKHRKWRVAGRKKGQKPEKYEELTLYTAEFINEKNFKAKPVKAKNK
jgi:hypothetical protein